MSKSEDTINSEELSSSESTYRVQLENYYGPLELLLYLVRKVEIDVFDLSLREVVQQYLHFLESQLEGDLSEVSETLLLMATLLELKSRLVLPREELELEEAFSLKQNPLLQEIWEFRRIRQLADFLALREALEVEKYTSGFVLEPLEVAEESSSIYEHLFRDIDVWAIINAYEKIRQEIPEPPPQLQREEVPIEEILLFLRKKLEEEKRLEVLGLFQERGERNWMAGAFIALLELSRQGQIYLEQETPFGPLWAIWRGDGRASEQVA